MDFTSVYGSSKRTDIMLFAKHCEALAGDRQMPQRRDFRPADVAWLLGRLYLIDVLEGGADYRFRLFGIFWEKLYGFDLTDQRLSELEAAGHLTALRNDYDAVVRAHKPLFHSGKLIWPDQKFIKYERLLIPFTLGGDQVSQIVVVAGCDVALDDLTLQKGKGRPRLVLD